MAVDPDELLLHGAIATRLLPVRPGEGREGELRLGLFERIHRSALAHAEYLTVRHEDGSWLPCSDGVTGRTLRSDASVRVEILRLSAGARLPLPQDATAQEILVLGGALEEDGAPLAATLQAPVRRPYAHGIRRRAQPDPALHAAADTEVYLRQLLVDTDRLPELEAHWWSLAPKPSNWVDPGRRRWYPSSQGVEVLPLHGDSQVVSMLVRFAAGASVADHRHALDEDCLVLEGEMFLGDILLRTGDYQLAPAGGAHFGETSDVGVLFFFHGALDPVLRGDPA